MYVIKADKAVNFGDGEGMQVPCIKAETLGSRKICQHFDERVGTP